MTSADGAEAAGVLRFTAQARRTAALDDRLGAPAGHEHGVDAVSAALLVLDGLVALGVVVLLAVRRRPAG